MLHTYWLIHLSYTEQREQIVNLIWIDIYPDGWDPVQDSKYNGLKKVDYNFILKYICLTFKIYMYGEQFNYHTFYTYLTFYYSQYQK